MNIKHSNQYAFDLIRYTVLMTIICWQSMMIHCALGIHMAFSNSEKNATILSQNTRESSRLATTRKGKEEALDSQEESLSERSFGFGEHGAGTRVKQMSCL